MGRRGFTLIEILVVVAILAILALIVFGQLRNGTGKARDTARISDIEQIALALRLYAEQNDGYPAHPAGIRVGEGTALDTALAPFIKTPHDPNGPGNGTYFYWYDSEYNCPLAGGIKTVVWATRLENPNRSNWTQTCTTVAADRFIMILN